MQNQVFSAVFTFVLFSGAVSAQPPKAFLDSVEARLEGISIPYNLKQWEFYTTGKSDSLVHFEKLWSSYVRDSALFATAVRFKESDKEATRARRWELLHNLLLGEKVSANPEILERVDSLSQIHFSFRASLRDSQKTDNQISKILRTSPDRDLRREAYFAQAQRGALLAEGIQKLMRQRNDLARELGYPNYYELGMELAGLSRSFLLTVLKQLDSLTGRPYRDLLSRVQKKLNVKELEPWDLSFAHGELELKLDPYFPKDSLLPYLKRTMKGIGYRLDSLPIIFDTESRPGKSQHAYSFGIDPPRDVRILMNAAIGVNSYNTAFHECGHSVHSCYVSQPTWLLRNWIPGCFAEGMAENFAGLIKQKKWLTGYARLPEKLAEEYLASASEKELIYVRSVLVNLYFEFFAYQNPEQDLNQLYWDLYEKHTFLPRHEEAKGWAGIVHFTTHPIYLQNYLVADMIAAQTLYRLKQEFGELVDNPRFAAFMNEKYFAPGGAKPWTDLVQEATGSELNPAYYMEELVLAKTSGETKK